MGKMKSFWVVGIFVVGGAMIAAPAQAMPPNQSDNTGTNIWNNTAPVFRGGGKLDPAIISTARRLSKDLDDAYSACAASKAAAANAPRRFARGADNPQVPCISGECQRLNSLVEETKTFLNSLDSSQVQLLRASRVLKIW